MKASVNLSDEAKFGLGVAVLVLTVAGLAVAAWAVHGFWYWAGLAVFVAGVLVIFLLIRLSIPKAPDSPEGEPAPPGQ